MLDAAQARGLIAPNTANPARWRGHLAHLLPKRRKLSRGHHAAMPYADVPAFLADLRTRDAMVARALEIVILTALRTNEVLGAGWDEIDLNARTWTIPASRMKGAREHRVPLAPAVLAMLANLPTLGRTDLIFSGNRAGKPLSNMAMQMLLRRMGQTEITVHEFRSSFRDWAGDATSYPRELAEAALAHVAGDETERAYRRGDALERRREMMEEWAEHCGGRWA